jgi:hypothetical protein
MAILGLTSEAAQDQPLLCVVDDAQWLDRASAQALDFVARRLLAERVALLLAARDLGDTLTGLPELVVEGLNDRDARALLELVLPARVDGPVLDRLIIEARGNPLALLEMPRGLTPTQLAGGFGLPTALPLSSQIEEKFARRIGNQPADAQRLLLLAAADPLGDPALLWRAARMLGISESAAESAGRRLSGARRPSCVPPSPGPICGLPSLGPECAPRSPSRARRGDRSRGRPRPPRVAPRAGDLGARRASCRGAGGVRGSSTDARWFRGRGGVPRASGVVDA